MLPSRVAYVLAARGPAIVIGLLVLGALGLGAAGLAHANPQTTQVTDHVDRVTVESSLSTRATITGDSAFYDRGETVRDHPVYLTETSPNVTLSLRTTFASAAGSADQRIELVYTASRGGEVFWQRTDALASEQSLRGETVVTEATVSATDVLGQLDAYRDELGSAATVSVGVRTTTDYAVGDHEGSLAERSGIQAGAGWYAVQTVSASRTHSTPVTRTVTVGVPDERLVNATGVAGAVLVLAGLVLAVPAYRMRRRDTGALRTDVHHDRYADWISRGSLPDMGATTAVRTETLEDLVDVAIDTGERVVYDAARDRYAVFRAGTAYYYDPFWAGE